MNANKVIHEARGECWHEIDESKTTGNNVFGHMHYCKCGEFWSLTFDFKPDYTDPVHYCELMDWMREDDRFRIFGNWLMRTYGDSQFRYLMKSRLCQVSLIAEWKESGKLKE